jgi:Rrf2 family iron-sulfur cluster assembly transcriptional regulator
MLFSRQSEYAIRALTFLALQPAGKVAGGRAISEAEGIPMPFLWKILHTLTKRRLIRSFKGLHGGYELAMPASSVTLSMIIGATDSLELTGSCVLGLPLCNEENGCPLHETWKELRGKVTRMLDQNTLADLAEVARNRASRPQATPSRKQRSKGAVSRE